MGIGVVRRKLLSLVRPLSVWFGTRHKRVPSKFAEYQNLNAVLFPGMIVLVRKKWRLSNLFIPGKYKHALMYVGGGQFVEAVPPVVKYTELIDVVSQNDKIMCLYPQRFSNLHGQKAAQIMQTLVNKEYDFEFEPGDDQFYCSESIAWCWRRATNFEFEFVSRTIMGVETVLPDDFRKAVSKMVVVWTNGD